MRFYSTADLPTDLAEKSFAANIARIMPNGTAPLFAISGLAQKITAKDIEHGYWTKTMEFTNMTVVGAILAAETTIDVVSTAGLVPNHVLRVVKAFSGGDFVAPELIKVVSIIDATSFVSVRGFAGTLARDLVDAEVLPAVGNAHPEGSVKPLHRAIVPVRVLNNTQIFRNAWAQSKTLAAVKQIVGKGTVAENRGDAAAFHASDIETATIFSRISNASDPVTGEPLHTMDGIEALIETHAPGNLKEAGATTDYGELEDLLDPVFDQKTDMMGGNKRTIFCGSTALKVINNIGRLSGEYQIVDEQTNFGLAFSTFTTTRGKFDMVEHPIFNTNPEWKKMALVMDLSSFDFAYLEGRDTEVTFINENNQSTDGTDATGGVLTTELTIQLINPFACAIIYNLRVGVAEA
jgi:hypothetical protein